MTAHRRPLLSVLAALVGAVLAVVGALPADAASYQRISGEGSSWAGNAVAQWQADIKTQGVTVDYTPNGSSQGRKDFASGINADFAVSEIPYRGDTSDPKDSSYPSFKYTMMPMVAGGTSFMYNLQVGGSRFTNLKLSQATLAKIFTGQVTRWNAAAVKADNPGVNLPNQEITVVVRSEGSGATAQFTLWLLRQYPGDYRHLCSVTKQCDGKHATSYFPYQHLSNFVAQSGSTGVTTYTVNTQFTLSYDEYSYAQQVRFPVAKIKNAAGFYTQPTATAVAVALTQAKINTNKSSASYLSQDLSKVYTYKDPRTYPLSAYSYFFVPTQSTSGFSSGKGATLGRFTQYALCEGQQTMGTLGYSPLPMNLVLAAMQQILKIPGVDSSTEAKIKAVQSSSTSSSSGNPCNNPTFQPGDDPAHNKLVDTAPFPAGCDAACQAPWKSAAAATNSSGPDYGKHKSAAAAAKASGSTTSAAASGVGATGAAAAKAASAGAAAAGASGAACDPDTGTCTSAAGTAAIAGTPVSTVLPGQKGWAGPQTLMAVSGLLLLLLLAAPPVVTRLLRDRGAKDDA